MPPSPPSDPIPEGPARRAALTAEIAAATGLTEQGIAALLADFYARAKEDALLGPVFARVADWDHHLARVGEFWSSVALMTGRYHGQPMRAHHGLGLTAAHFARWLDLFGATARAHCTPEGAAHLIGKAGMIARSLEHGLAFAAGVLPPRGAVPAGGPASSD